MSLRSALRAVEPSLQEQGDQRPGDELVPVPDAVMDRGFTVSGPPALLWPWIEQLGKDRAGWYLPTAVERFVPKGRRATRQVEPQWLSLVVGDVIPDYGGKHATFEVAEIDAPHTLVYRSQRGSVRLSWAITLTPVVGADATRVHLRLRLGPLRRPWLATSIGDWFDLLTIAGMAAGLQERLRSRPDSRDL